MRELGSGLPRWYDIAGWFRAVFSRRPHPWLQFIRYGIAGVAAMLANLVFFAIALEWVFPIPEGKPATAPGLPATWSETGEWLRLMAGDPRVAQFVRANAVAFLMANAVAYVLNFCWVFESGRHSRSLEITLFFVVSLISFVMGTALASLLVGSFGINEYLAKAGDIVAAVLINFVCRKFLIFKN